MKNKKVCRVCHSPEPEPYWQRSENTYMCAVCSVVFVSPKDWYVEEGSTTTNTTEQPQQLTLNLQDEVDKRDNLINGLNTRIAQQKEIIKAQEARNEALHQIIKSIRNNVNILTDIYK